MELSEYQKEIARYCLDLVSLKNRAYLNRTEFDYVLMHKSGSNQNKFSHIKKMWLTMPFIERRFQALGTSKRNEDGIKIDREKLGEFAKVHKLTVLKEEE